MAILQGSEPVAQTAAFAVCGSSLTRRLDGRVPAREETRTTEAVVRATCLLRPRESVSADLRKWNEGKMGNGRAAEERKMRAPQRYPNPTSAVPGWEQRGIEGIMDAGR